MPEHSRVPASFTIGSVRIAPATVLAPMAGVTDTVFRRFIKNASQFTIGERRHQHRCRHHQPAIRLRPHHDRVHLGRSGLSRMREVEAQARYLHVLRRRAPHLRTQLFGSNPDATARRIPPALSRTQQGLRPRRPRALGCPARETRLSPATAASRACCATCPRSSASSKQSAPR